MGYYVNHPQMTNREFLKSFAKEISLDEVKAVEGEEVALCLFNNFEFTALGIGFSADEVQRWIDSHYSDIRPRRYYSIKKDHVRQFVAKGVL